MGPGTGIHSDSSVQGPLGEVQFGLERVVPDSRVVAAVLTLPILAYIVALWLVRPLSFGPTISLSLAAPAIFIIALATIRVPRAYAFALLGRVGVEFTMLAIMAMFAVMSLSNSEAPVRSLRVIFPCLLPFAIFGHLIVMGYLAPEKVLRISRWIIFSALIFSSIPLILSPLLPPLKAYIFTGNYRNFGFFENAIQHSIALGTVIPLIMTEFFLARKGSRKLLWGFLMIVMAYTIFRAGSKSAMAISFAMGIAAYTLLSFRSRNFLKIAVLFVSLGLIGVFVYFFGMPLAEMINPIMAEKLHSLFSGGVSNYHSIESRQMLWNEAIRQGQRHWLVGSGAGEKVMGLSHAHNLVLDYFKGIGFFGATAIVILCLTILFRTIVKGGYLLQGYGDDWDVRIFACYVSASTYVICNQMSDSFGPSTVGFLWLTYLVGRVSERSRFVPVPFKGTGETSNPSRISLK